MKPSDFEKRMHQAAAAMQNPRELYARLGQILLEHTRGFTPVRTGYLQSRYQVVLSSAHPPVLRNDAPYAPFVEFGTRYMEGRHMYQQGLDASFAESVELLRQYGERILSAVGGGGDSGGGEEIDLSGEGGEGGG